MNDGLTTSQSSIHRMKSGKQTPRFDEGMAILSLREKAKRERESSARVLDVSTAPVSGAAR